ncbi:MAG: substrate-binding domain-containing protein [Acetobacteraceae bacterium]|nr:substrate-binding domain-containing protein [Acetobacteraceae bacterium]
MTLFRRLLLASLALAASAGARAEAADIRVLTAGALRPVLDALLPAFESRNSTKVVLTTDTAGGVAARIRRGEPFDLAILTPAAVEPLATDAKVILVTPIASVGIGVAVKAGAPKPDISSSGAFRNALLAAPKVAMVDPASGGTSGAYLMDLFTKLGIADQMKPKLVLTQGGLAAERLVDGQATLALGQVSELLAVKGADVVGPLPPDIQTRTTYVAAMNPKASELPIILLATLAGPETLKLLPTYGMGPP